MYACFVALSTTSAKFLLTKHNARIANTIICILEEIGEGYSWERGKNIVKEDKNDLFLPMYLPARQSDILLHMPKLALVLPLVFSKYKDQVSILYSF